MSERATRTTLAVGAVEAPIALYRTFGDKRPEVTFDTAGPNGGKLWAVPTAKAAEDSLPEGGYRHGPVGDPLAETPDPLEEIVLPPENVPGSYGRILAEEGTGIEVPPEAVRRGVRLADGNFIDLTDHLAAVTEATRLEEMRVEAFIGSINDLWHRATGAYYIAPEGSGYTLALLRKAMVVQEVAAVVRWTKRTRQGLGVILPTHDGLLLVEVAWSALVRQPREEASGFAQMQVRDEHLDMAMQLVAEMTGPPLALDRLDDDAVVMKRDLRDRALAGEIPPLPGLDESTDPLSAQLAESLA